MVCRGRFKPKNCQLSHFKTYLCGVPELKNTAHIKDDDEEETKEEESQESEFATDDDYDEDSD